MSPFFAELKEHLRESYWFIPGIIGSGAVLLAISSISIEAEVASSALASHGWIYTRDANGARQLLSTIGGSLITVTGVVFSVTLVALTNASTQFGTRILRTFARDTGNKVVLGAFLGTFLYCLLIMRTITGGDNGFVPHLSVLIGIALSMLCFALLIYFIHHVIQIVQADNVIHALSEDLISTISRILPASDPIRPLAASANNSQIQLQNYTECYAPTGGYLEAIDYSAILKCAQSADAVVEILCSPGQFLFCGSVVARVSGPEDIELAARITRSFTLDVQRSYVQDLEFAFQQLVLVAVRSLSPALNDQLLAITCIDRLSESLEFVGRRRLPSPFLCDSNHKTRILIPPLRYADIVHMAFSLVAEVSRENAAVTAHILGALGRVKELVEDSEFRDAILALAADLHSRACDCLKASVDRRVVERVYHDNFVAIRVA